MVYETICRIIADQLDLDPSEIKPETDIIQDLNADSLDAVEVLSQIEEEFGIEIPDEETENFRIVDNIVKFVENNQ